MSTFPVPPDVRTDRDFRIIRGTDTAFREQKHVAASVTAEIAQGEWVVFDASGDVIKVAGATSAAPAQGALVNWTRYKKGDAVSGQADAAANQGITVVRGPYEALTKKYDPAPAYTIGDLLVVKDDGSGNGTLYPIAPAAATAVQIARAVGKVTAPPAGGVLGYASIGAAS
jgi:hypothetical protein